MHGRGRMAIPIINSPSDPALGESVVISELPESFDH